ncbi:MAG: hypothetical protein AVDCRST_MAG75-1746 [uncultured Propionibacteriaceae bacterium]|uniref:Glycosyltransferase RgtA/B/C/D-like domain-containing protein n=1 Tax=uncultured Propionibacteriaceae bacterium TaxID=257457 RepID=A0A6J4NPC3_9ACTN|nr:MAG: hypothetical protein AVDCRST_MAG75-1746 [uncultured Propionibacteriaceae bacterium]
MTAPTQLSRTVRDYIRNRSAHGAQSTESTAAPRRSQNLLLSPWAPAWMSLLALVLWAVSLPGVDVSKISGWGLLTGLPPLWYIAYAVALVAVVIALVSQSSRPVGPLRIQMIWRRRLLPSFAALLVMLFATTALVYDVPRYPWTYKHIGVTEYLRIHGVPATALDIYQNFPGFFYIVGVLHEITRIPLMAMARYAEVVAHALNAGVLYWTLGALTRSHRVKALTVIIFTLTNWVGQTYFAPQALAFPASLFVIGAFLRLIAAGNFRPMAGPLLEQLHRGGLFWSRVAALVLSSSIFALIVVSHQFTPIALLMQLAAVAVVFRLRNPWLIGVFTLIEGLWLIHAFPYISNRFDLIERPNYDNVRPPSALSAVLPGADVMARAPHLITLFIVIATIAAVGRIVLRTRTIHTIVVPAALALAPGAILLVQPYGQEGVLRWYLFALPWCSFVIARDLCRVESVGPEPGSVAQTARPRGYALWAKTAAGSVVVLLGVLAVPAFLGNEMINRVWKADVTANQWFEQNTPQGSELLLLVSAYPHKSTGMYDRHVTLDEPAVPRSLGQVDGFSEATGSAKKLFEFTRDYAQTRAAQHDVYLAVGPTQKSYLELYGLVSDKVYDDYLTRLQEDNGFELVYSAEGSYLFRVL